MFNWSISFDCRFIILINQSIKPYLFSTFHTGPFDSKCQYEQQKNNNKGLRLMKKWEMWDDVRWGQEQHGKHGALSLQPFADMQQSRKFNIRLE